MVLHQQQQARGRRCGVLARHLYPDVGCNQRFDAGAAAGLVKLDGAEQVAQVTDRQRWLLVCSRSGDDFIDAVGPVDD